MVAPPDGSCPMAARALDWALIASRGAGFDRAPRSRTLARAPLARAPFARAPFARAPRSLAPTCASRPRTLDIRTSHVAKEAQAAHARAAARHLTEAPADSPMRSPPSSWRRRCDHSASPPPRDAVRRYPRSQSHESPAVPNARFTSKGPCVEGRQSSGLGEKPPSEHSRVQPPNRRGGARGGPWSSSCKTIRQRRTKTARGLATEPPSPRREPKPRAANPSPRSEPKPAQRTPSSQRPRASAASHRSTSRLSDAQPTEQRAPTLRPQRVTPTA
jgi:hypothetical protein